MSGLILKLWVVLGGLIAVSLVGFALYLAAVIRRRRRPLVPTGQVIGVVGRMGAGKSVFATRYALRVLASGVDVAANYTIEVPEGLPGRFIPFSGWNDIADLHDCVLIIDEAHLYAPSHQHRNFPMIARTSLAFARKRNMDVVWCSQHEDRVNRTLRDLTTSMVLCRRLRPGVHSAEWFEPENFRKPGESFLRERFRLDPAVRAAFSTSEVIAVDEYALQGDASAAAVRRSERRVVFGS